MSDLATQFFTGLDDEASLIFMGLLACAFLIGLLPAGLSYLVRVRAAHRRIDQQVGAHDRLSAERDALATQLGGERTRAAELTERLRTALAERSRQEASLTQLGEQHERARADILGAMSAKASAEDYTESLRVRVSTLTAEVQSLRHRDRPKPAPSAFDAETLASLRAVRTKAAALEERVGQLTADNERLRRERAT